VVLLVQSTEPPPYVAALRARSGVSRSRHALEGQGRPVTTPAYLTAKETAELLRRSVKSFYRMVEADPTFPVTKLPSGGLLVPRAALERWLHDHTQGTRGPLPRIDLTETSTASQRTDGAHA
jgi:hypothetical protein